MMPRILLYFLSLILITTSAIAREHSGKLILKKKLENFTTSLESDYRYDEEGLDYRHYDLGIRIPFLDNWLTSINYRTTFRYKKNKWRIEKRPHISLQKTFNTNLAKIQIRSRQEYRFRSDKTTSTRNRIRIIVKPNETFFHLKPFIGNEIFYDFDKKKYNRNWLVLGADFPKTNFGKYSIYYKHITSLNSQDNWNYDYSIVFKLTYEF